MCGAHPRKAGADIMCILDPGMARVGTMYGMDPGETGMGATLHAGHVEPTSTSLDGVPLDVCPGPCP